MLDKAKLGKRYTCYECGTKFYDLNRPAALCPECNADQAGAPVRDMRSILSSGRRRVKAEPEPEEEAEEEESEEVGDGLDDPESLLDDEDDEIEDEEEDE